MPESRCKLGDFPGGPVVKNPPFNAKDMGLIPGPGIKVLHAVRQLSLSVVTKTQHSQSFFFFNKINLELRSAQLPSKSCHRN